MKPALARKVTKVTYAVETGPFPLKGSLTVETPDAR